jgi:hypothetical protein
MAALSSRKVFAAEIRPGIMGIKQKLYLGISASSSNQGPWRDPKSAILFVTSWKAISRPLSSSFRPSPSGIFS